MFNDTLIDSFITDRIKDYVDDLDTSRDTNIINSVVGEPEAMISSNGGSATVSIYADSLTGDMDVMLLHKPVIELLRESITKYDDDQTYATILAVKSACDEMISELELEWPTYLAQAKQNLTKTGD